MTWNVQICSGDDEVEDFVNVDVFTVLDGGNCIALRPAETDGDDDVEIDARHVIFNNDEQIFGEIHIRGHVTRADGSMKDVLWTLTRYRAPTDYDTFIAGQTQKIARLEREIGRLQAAEATRALVEAGDFEVVQKPQPPA